MKVYDSTAEWKRALVNGETLRSALDQRQIIVIRGSTDGGIVREPWDWNLASFQRLLPGVQRVEVQGMICLSIELREPEPFAPRCGTIASGRDHGLSRGLSQRISRG